MHTYRETHDDSTYSCLTLQCCKNDVCSVKTILQSFELFPGRQHASGYPHATYSIRLQLPRGHVITKGNDDSLQCALLVSSCIWSQGH